MVRTDVQRRARLFGVSSNDPMLRRKRRGKGRAKEGTAEGVGGEKVKEKETETRGRFYCGTARIPPGSFPAAAKRFGGAGALEVARRTADTCAGSAGFEPRPHGALTDEYVPRLSAEPLAYVSGPTARQSTRQWPSDAEHTSGSRPKKVSTSEWFRHETTVGDAPDCVRDRGRALFLATEREIRAHDRALNRVEALRRVPGPGDALPRSWRGGYSESDPPRRRPASAPCTARPRTTSGGVLLTTESPAGVNSRACFQCRPGSAIHARRENYDGAGLERKRRDSAHRELHLQRLKWSLLYNLFKTLEVHALHDGKDTDAGFLDGVADMFDMEWAKTKKNTRPNRAVPGRLARVPTLARGPGLAKAPTLTRISFLSAKEQSFRKPARDDHLVTKDAFVAAIDRAGVNFPESMIRRLFEIVDGAKKYGLSGFTLLFAFAAFQVHRDQGTLDAPRLLLPRLLAVFAERASRPGRGLVDLFALAAKSPSERRTIKQLVDTQLLPALEDVTIEATAANTPVPVGPSSSRGGRPGAGAGGGGDDHKEPYGTRPSSGSNLLLTKAALAEATGRSPDLRREFERQLADAAVAADLRMPRYAFDAL